MVWFFEDIVVDGRSIFSYLSWRESSGFEKSAFSSYSWQTLGLIFLTSFGGILGHKISLLFFSMTFGAILTTDIFEMIPLLLFFFFFFFGTIIRKQKQRSEASNSRSSHPGGTILKDNITPFHVPTHSYNKDVYMTRCSKNYNQCNISNDHGHARDHVHGPDHVPPASLNLERIRKINIIRNHEKKHTQKKWTHEWSLIWEIMSIPAVGFFGLTLGVSSTSNVSRFKLSGRI